MKVLFFFIPLIGYLLFIRVRKLVDAIRQADREQLKVEVLLTTLSGIAVICFILLLLKLF